MLILARHASTELNPRRVVQGTQDFPLTAEGRAEAEALGSWLRRWEVATVFSSELRRARETAEIAADALALDAPRPHPLLHERLWGPYEGMSREELLAARGATDRADSFDPHDWHGVAGVESDEAIWKRFLAFAKDTDLWRVARERGALVVTHAGVLKACLQITFSIPHSRRRCFRMHPGHALVFSVEPTGLELWEMWMNDAWARRHRQTRARARQE
jgi:broad specificity phosphatase PhoE